MATNTSSHATNTTVENTDRYDRFTRTFGIESVGRLETSHVYIYGYSELAYEIIKNLVLSGVKNIHIFKTSGKIKEKSFCIKSFYISNIDETHSDALKNYIIELNPSTNVHIHSYDDFDISIQNSNNAIGIIVNDFPNIFKYDNVKYVYAVNTSYSGYVRTYPGENHLIENENDTVYEDIKVLRITYDNDTPIVYTESSYLEDGDIIQFKQLQGNCNALKDREFKIFNVQKNKVNSIEVNSFQIDLTERVDFVNGFVHRMTYPSLYSPERDETENLGMEYTCFDPNKNCYPMVSIIGGVASNEAIKLITHKYTPLKNTFKFCDLKIKEIMESVDINDLMSNMNIMMVGCGAIGCEWMKNLSMLGYNQLDVTDPDHIEVSNLSRQFLFRNKDVKMSKSEVAVNYIKNKYPHLSTNAFNHKLTQENKNIVNELFEGKDIIINALDNNTARRFIDSVCLEKCLPLFESGTMGMKGNTQPIIPYLTETYSDSHDGDEENSFPVCTIKNFPNQIVHTIHWARDYFEIFTRAFENINKYKENPDFYKELSDFDSNQCIKDINMFCSKEYDDWTDIVYLVKDMFDERYYKEIKQLLFCYPEDHMISGELFWSNGKRCPKVIQHYMSTSIINYFEFTTKLICNIMDIESEFNREELMKVMLDFQFPDFEPDTTKKIAKNDKELKEKSSTIETVQLNENLYLRQIYTPQYFEKDDDTNYHIKFITAASNCRAEIYGIDISTEYETKGIAGKIIPAVATTTATVVGLICLELIKYVSCLKTLNIEDLKSYYINLSDNTFIGFEPIETKKIEYNGRKYSQWHKINYTCSENDTIEDFINFIKNHFNSDIETICYNSSIIYSDMLGGDTTENLHDCIREYTDENKVKLTIIDDDNNDMPDVIVYL
jgi:molybdopterin/thiamine biosynthesis adenylyltransferase